MADGIRHSGSWHGGSQVVSSGGQGGMAWRILCSPLEHST
jgi:hypothetical protein